MRVEHGMNDLLTIPSGQTVNFTLTLQDDMGTTVSNENTASAQISVLSMEQYENFLMLLENGKRNTRRILQDIQNSDGGYLQNSYA